MKRYIFLTVSLFVLFTTLSAACTINDNNIKFVPNTTDEILLNPDKGWIFLDTAVEYREDLGRTGDYALVQTVGILTAWAELEPEEGVYDWERLDNMIDYWVTKGKNINFRISTDDFPYLGVIQGCPDWVYDYGVPKQEIYAENTVSCYPDYLNPIYQEKLRDFLKVFAERYGDKEYLKSVDLRGYGRWGEWHSGYVYETWEERIKALKFVFDAWYDAWGNKKPLYLSYSHEWLSDVSMETPPQTYEEYLKYSAFDYAFAHKNVNFRRDGVSIAITDFERRFSDEIYKDGRMQISEFGRQFSDYLEEGMLQQALEEGLELHPNYMVMIGWDGNGTAQDFYEYAPEAMEYGLKNMGYRLYPREFEYRKEVKKNEKLVIRHKWENTACGVVPEGYTQCFYICNSNGDVMSKTVSEGFRSLDLKKGTVCSIETSIDISGIPEGEYTLDYSVLDRDGNGILLPVEGKKELNRYSLGTFNILE